MKFIVNQLWKPWLLLSPGLLLMACGTPQTGPELPHYRCDHGLEFTVQLGVDSASIQSNRGVEVLYLDAGGTTPQQRFFSNQRMRAEFGLGATAREAVLRYPLAPLVVRCLRDE